MSKTITTDACTPCRRKNGKKSSGQVLLDVDDFIEGGDDRHRKVMDKFYENTNVEKPWTLLQQAMKELSSRDEGFHRIASLTSRSP